MQFPPGRRILGILGTHTRLLIYQKRAKLRDGRGLIHATRKTPQQIQWGHAHPCGNKIDNRFKRDAIVEGPVRLQT